MSLIISENGKNAERLSADEFDQESHLQQYIYDNPDVVPFYEIDDNIRLLILAREFNTNSGPIDALGIDQDGNIYLIETKMYKNSDKRKVVAQVLDYGASLWSSSLDFTDFLLQLDRHVEDQFGVSTSDKLREYFNIESDKVDVLIENMRMNLNSGTFKFVVLMNNLHKQLKDLVVFLNRSSQFDIYAVELEYYKHSQYEIIIPRMFGTEVKKDVLSKSKSRQSESNEWLIELIRSLDAPEYIHMDFVGATPHYLRFTTDVIDSILPKRNVNDGGWRNGRSCMYEIYSKSGIGSDVQVSLELNKDDQAKHEAQIHNQIITITGKTTKPYNRWLMCKTWKLNYNDEASLKSELLRIFEQEIPKFEEKIRNIV